MGTNSRDTHPATPNEQRPNPPGKKGPSNEELHATHLHITVNEPKLKLKASWPSLSINRSPATNSCAASCLSSCRCVCAPLLPLTTKTRPEYGLNAPGNIAMRSLSRVRANMPVGMSLSKRTTPTARKSISIGSNPCFR